MNLNTRKPKIVVSRLQNILLRLQNSKIDKKKKRSKVEVKNFEICSKLQH